MQVKGQRKEDMAQLRQDHRVEAVVQVADLFIMSKPERKFVCLFVRFWFLCVHRFCNREGSLKKRVWGIGQITSLTIVGSWSTFLKRTKTLI